jgi:hypothetical protein
LRRLAQRIRRQRRTDVQHSTPHLVPVCRRHRCVAAQVPLTPGPIPHTGRASVVRLERAAHVRGVPRV